MVLNLFHSIYLASHNALDIWSLQSWNRDGRSWDWRAEKFNLSSIVINLLYAVWAWQMFNSGFFFLGSFCGFSTGPIVNSGGLGPPNCKLSIALHLSWFSIGTFLWGSIPHRFIFAGFTLFPPANLLEIIIMVLDHLFHSHLHIWITGNLYHSLTVNGIEINFHVHLSF